MTSDRESIRRLIKEFELRKLFIEELGWDRLATKLVIPLNGADYRFEPVAQKRGFVVYEHKADSADSIPCRKTRLKLEHELTKLHHEHLIVFTDATSTTQRWQWVRRESGMPTAPREEVFLKGQSGERLAQKLSMLYFAIEEEDKLTVLDAKQRVKDALNKDRVTKRFYDLFKGEHAKFLGIIKGIPEELNERWYASVMLNRLMFIYFIQKKGFLDGNPNYLSNKLSESKARGKNEFYKRFLCRLFFEGFARREDERSAAVNKLLGEVPFFNGGLFMPHQIEEACGKDIEIEDAAFESLFAFFDRYQWHLDDRPLKSDNEINPDVLGYIFEKYINQKQMGAYYTKEDITEYISKNTVIPFILDQARANCKIAFEGKHAVWNLLSADPDRYIYEPVRRGVVAPDGSVIPESELPDFVQNGMHDPKARMFDKRYNLGDAEFFDKNGEKLTLPTETWREYVERRKRCLELREKLAAGEVREVNDLITYNLDIRQFAQDVVVSCEGADLLSSLWKAINSVTVLDPTCGSGAFLFAALNILQPLYESCIDRMEAFLAEWGESGKKQHPNYHKAFSSVLGRLSKHPSRNYFVFKSIIVNNLYGVDIMDEAVEICKLRLFLKLVAQVDNVEHIEPLPDIDFNIRAGNTLVGFENEADVKKAVEKNLIASQTGVLENIKEKAEGVSELFMLFREQQTEHGGEVTHENKAELQNRLGELSEELDLYLASEYGIDENNIPKKSEFKARFDAWKASHKPFHWWAEFYEIISRGGFDVIIGNPPYVEYSAAIRSQYEVLSYSTAQCGNLYAFISERCLNELHPAGRMGLIVPLPSINTTRMETLQSLIKPVHGNPARSLWVSAFDERPSNLFTGVDQRLVIEVFGEIQRLPSLMTTGINRWAASIRDYLFFGLNYGIQNPPLSFNGTSVLKVRSSSLEHKMLPALYSNRPIDIYRSNKPTDQQVEYRTAGGRYWKVFLDSQSESETLSAKIAYLQGISGTHAVAVLSSSTFWWYYSTHFDMYNLKDYMIFGFRFSDASEDVKEKLERLGKELIHSLLTNAEVRVIYSKTRGAVSSFTFEACKSKHIIDQIDVVLAEHYGFTDEELDFIINYDIKYRMGRNAGGSDEEEG